MVLGALWCFKSKTEDYNLAIAALKAKHGLAPSFEVKWSKAGTGKLAFYEQLLDFFFDTPGLFFRAWVVPDKSILTHAAHQQNHDDWYYKMYFYLLRNIIVADRKYHVYLDIKDTRSRPKLVKLHEVLANAHYDFQREIIAKMQHVHSHDIGLMQLADFLIGAISYNARGFATSPAKQALVNRVKTRTGFALDRSTLPSERKFNLCIWRPNEGGMEHA